MRGGVKLVSGGGVAPSASASAAGGHPGMWRTPTPYLFLGLAVLMGLIAVALLVLVRTRRKHGGGGREGDAEAAGSVNALVPLDREPKVVVVVIAGDTAPSYLASAKPLAAFLPPPQLAAGEP